MSKIDKSSVVVSIETAGSRGSAGLAQGGKLTEVTSFQGVMTHSAELLPAIKHLLETAGLDVDKLTHFAFTVGPGSFTGLRIAVSVAKMLVLAYPQIELLPVRTSDAIMQNVNRREGLGNVERLGTVIDAKRGNFFWSFYEHSGGEYRKVHDDRMLSSREILQEYVNKDKPLYLAGEGLTRYRQLFEAEGVEILPAELWQPGAESVFHQAVEQSRNQPPADPLSLQPLYIRRPEAVEKWERLKKTGNKK